MKTPRTQLTTVHRLADVPDFANDDEAAEFWSTHGPSEAFLDEAIIDDYPGLPPPRPRTSPVSVRFDPATVSRLRAVAERKHKGYQTLLKEFVLERLYEEEKREGIVGS